MGHETSRIPTAAGSDLYAIILIAAAPFGLGAALYARRPNSKDITRVNAIEYRDERDRVIARKGFSIVGACALLLTVAETLGTSIFAPEYVWLPSAQMIVLAVV